MTVFVLCIILTVIAKGYSSNHLQHFTTELPGTWQKFSADEHLMKDISYSQAMTNYSDVIIKAHVFDNESINLTCSSSKIPFGHNVEFLINNRSEDSMRYDLISKLCYNNADVCSPDICNCSNNGNTFMMVFKQAQKNSVYSCDMIFKYDKNGSKIQKVASVFINTTGVYNLPTTTIVIRTQFQNSTDQSVIVGSTPGPTNRTLPHKNSKDETCLKVTMVITITAYLCGFLISLMFNFLLLRRSRFNSCLKILSRINEFCTSTKKLSAVQFKVMKRVLFGMLSLLTFAIAYSVANHNDVCKFIWLFGALGYFIGCVLTVLFMSEVGPSGHHSTRHHHQLSDITDDEYYGEDSPGCEASSQVSNSDLHELG